MKVLDQKNFDRVKLALLVNADVREEYIPSEFNLSEHIMKDRNFNLEGNLELLNENEEITMLDANGDYSTAFAFIFGMLVFKAAIAIVLGLEIRKKIEPMIKALPGLLCIGMFIILIAMIGNTVDIGIPFEAPSNQITS